MRADPTSEEGGISTITMWCRRGEDSLTGAASEGKVLPCAREREDAHGRPSPKNVVGKGKGREKGGRKTMCLTENGAICRKSQSDDSKRRHGL